jgi:hypothetical protein
MAFYTISNSQSGFSAFVAISSVDLEEVPIHILCTLTPLHIATKPLRRFFMANARSPPKRMATAKDCRHQMLQLAP